MIDIWSRISLSVITMLQISCHYLNNLLNSHKVYPLSLENHNQHALVHHRLRVICPNRFSCACFFILELSHSNCAMQSRRRPTHAHIISVIPGVLVCSVAGRSGEWFALHLLWPSHYVAQISRAIISFWLPLRSHLHVYTYIPSMCNTLECAHSGAARLI